MRSAFWSKKDATQYAHVKAYRDKIGLRKQIPPLAFALRSTVCRTLDQGITHWSFTLILKNTQGCYFYCFFFPELGWWVLRKSNNQPQVMKLGTWQHQHLDTRISDCILHIWVLSTAKAFYCCLCDMNAQQIINDIYCLPPNQEDTMQMWSLNLKAPNMKNR